MSEIMKTEDEKKRNKIKKKKTKIEKIEKNKGDRCYSEWVRAK